MRFSPSGVRSRHYTGEILYKHKAYLCVQRVHHFTDLLEGINGSAIRVLKQQVPTT